MFMFMLKNGSMCNNQVASSPRRDIGDKTMIYSYTLNNCWLDVSQSDVISPLVYADCLRTVANFACRRKTTGSSPHNGCENQPIRLRVTP